MLQNVEYDISDNAVPVIYITPLTTADRFGHFLTTYDSKVGRLCSYSCFFSFYFYESSALFWWLMMLVLLSFLFSHADEDTPDFSIGENKFRFPHGRQSCLLCGCPDGVDDWLSFVSVLALTRSPTCGSTEHPTIRRFSFFASGDVPRTKLTGLRVSESGLDRGVVWRMCHSLSRTRNTPRSMC